mgnify:CR=1 FL=1
MATGDPAAGARARVDPGWVVAALIALLAAWPLLARPSLPDSVDSTVHIFRTQIVLDAWRAGVLYPRWAPDLYYGFGYPVFNYYAPLTYHLGALFALPSGDAVLGVKAVLALAAAAGALGMYGLGRALWGGRGGVVSAAAFALAPYVLFIDPLERGAAPETFSIGWAPVVFWAFARLRRAPTARALVLAALALAALLLAHNLLPAVFLGLLIVWLLADLAAHRAWDRAHLAPWLLALALGAGLTAFFWLPAVVERGAVQYQTLTGSALFDYRHYFARADELLAPALWFDLGALRTRFHYNVGVAQWALAVLGAASALRARPGRATLLVFTAAGLALLYLMTPASLWLWEAAPILPFLQFPTRLLGPAALALAVLAGAAVRWLPEGAGGRLPGAFGLAAFAALYAAAVPLLNPPPWPDYGPVSAARILETELSGRLVGTTAGVEFLPVGVQQRPQPQPALVESLRAGAPDRVDRAALPPGASVLLVGQGPLHSAYQAASPGPFRLRLFTFYFPGWSASVDGRRVAVDVARPEGWLVIPVPAGEHEVRVQFEETPVRVLAWVLSGLSALAVVLLVLGKPAFLPPLEARVGARGAEALPLPAAALLAGAVLVGLGLRAWAQSAGAWVVRSTGREVVVAQHAHFTPLEAGPALLAFDLPHTQARPGATFPLTLYWKALKPVGVNYRVFVHLLGPDGQLWGQSDKWHPANIPMVAWPLDRYVADAHTVPVSADAPPGRYRLQAGLWDADTGARLRVLDAAGASTEQDSVLLTDQFVITP